MSKLDNLRAFRARQAAGRRIYKIALDQIGTELLLEEAGLLPPDNDDPSKVEQALARFIELAIVESGFGPESGK